ncbi:alcohol dehydrogenase [Nitzschia inconspicua]|uniref:Alcohol dehydrogenase n=1 Tax=Nitzschia inconspicua TaxID=303405 RepID=A0A9K3M583_9STRA|nr:alcohol dehydrogenase [Nitzschia inconspicua]
MSSTPEIPEKMKQMVVLEGGSTVKECKLEIREVDVPKPQSHEVLVKMVAAAVNPSDYGSWKTAKKNDDGIAIGNEGSGIVVAIGSGLLTKARVSIGQKVGVVGPKNNQGTYSDLGNYGHGQNNTQFQSLGPYGAASQLGQMMVKLSNNSELTNGVEIINVVRRAEQVKLLQELGAKHIINSSDSDWKDQLQTKIKELECTVAFDAVAGSSSGDILSCLPNGGTLYVYGGLAGSCRDIDPMDLIYRRKDVKGFFLKSWVTSGGLLYTILRMAMAGRKVNAGLGKDGWASSQFKDVSLEKMQEECARLLDSGATGIKLRVRFDE